MSPRQKLLVLPKYAIEVRRGGDLARYLRELAARELGFTAREVVLTWIERGISVRWRLEIR